LNDVATITSYQPKRTAHAETIASSLAAESTSTRTSRQTAEQRRLAIWLFTSSARPLDMLVKLEPRNLALLDRLDQSGGRRCDAVFLSSAAAAVILSGSGSERTYVYATSTPHELLRARQPTLAAPSSKALAAWVLHPQPAHSPMGAPHSHRSDWDSGFIGGDNFWPAAKSTDPRAIR
jgi:hypothetical protein